MPLRDGDACPMSLCAGDEPSPVSAPNSSELNSMEKVSLASSDCASNSGANLRLLRPPGVSVSSDIIWNAAWRSDPSRLGIKLGQWRNVPVALQARVFRLGPARRRRRVTARSISFHV